VRGGQGDDSLSGGAGDDWMSGDRGSDTISGGAGADIFNVIADVGLDRVLDFNRAEGDRVKIEPGSTYTTAQVGADVVISVSGGGQMVLAGVQLSSLSGDWIFTG
jgi:Ca2+-binding RTX toxin-like protein